LAVEGGAISLLSGLTCPRKLGGIFGLSSFMPMQGKLKDMIAENKNANKDTKIFMGHGDVDQTIRYEWGEMTSEKLKEWGYDVDFRTYPYARLRSLNPSRIY
jgi:predicted esterase